MIVYKVVRKNYYLGSYLSSSNVCDQAEVTYNKEKFAQAPQHLAEEGYHLCVFRSLNKALIFSEGMSRTAVWAARATAIHKPGVNNLSPGRVSFCAPYIFRLLKDEGIPYWPEGTYFAKGVKLLAPVRSGRSARRLR